MLTTNTINSTDESERLYYTIADLQRKKAELEAENRRLEGEAGHVEFKMSRMVQRQAGLKDHLQQLKSEMEFLSSKLERSESEVQVQESATAKMQITIENTLSTLDELRYRVWIEKEDLNLQLQEWESKFAERYRNTKAALEACPLGKTANT